MKRVSEFPSLRKSALCPGSRLGSNRFRHAYNASQPLPASNSSIAVRSTGESRPRASRNHVKHFAW
jgi:hypothetical protein